MAHRRQITFLAVVLAASLLLAACAPQPAAAPAAAPTAAPQAAAQPAAQSAEKPAVYKVGFISHLTGDAAVYGQSAKRGVDLAVDEINAKGGIGGVKVELVVEDDRMDSATAQTAFLKITQSDKVPVAVGPASSTVSLSLCKKLPEWNVIDVSISSNEKVRDCGPNYFSVFPNDIAQGPEWVKVAQQLGATEVALMYINNDYGNGVKNQFTQAFEAAGGKILISQPFELGGKDFRTEVLKVKEKNPKFIFIVDHTAEGSVVLKQAKELGINAQWVADVSMQSPELVELAAGAAEGMIALRAGTALTPEFEAFSKAFQAKYNMEPTVWADFHYDAMMLIAKAIEKGGYSVDGIRQGLIDVSQSYVGPSGNKAFDEFHVSAGVYDWMIVKNGKWEVYKGVGK